MEPPSADVWFQAGIFLASARAGVFWLASAIGKTVEPPWRKSQDVPPELRAAHQAKWNTRAAAAASIAALLQGIQILYHHPLTALLTKYGVFIFSLFHFEPYRPESLPRA